MLPLGVAAENGIGDAALADCPINPIVFSAELHRYVGGRTIAGSAGSKSGGRSRAKARDDAAFVRPSIQAVD